VKGRNKLTPEPSLLQVKVLVLKKTYRKVAGRLPSQKQLLIQQSRDLYTFRAPSMVSMLYSHPFAPADLLSSRLLNRLAVLAPSPQTSTSFTPFSSCSADSF